MGKLINLIFLMILVACSSSKPDQVITIKSPVDGVFYTVETHHGQGALDNDHTWVYLHKEHSGKSAKALVLSGAYVNVSKIEWSNSIENIIFFDGGSTERFCNEVTLSIDGVSETFHAYLQETPSTFKAQK
jgi:hypothetical protein